MKVELEVPKGYEKIVEELARDINWDALLLRALKKELQEELKMEVLKRIASKSKLTEKDALRLGDEIKEGIARRHGLL